MTRAYQIAGARTRVTIELPDGSNKVVLVGPTGAFYKSGVSNNKLGNIQNFDSSVKYYSIGDYTFTSKGQEELMGQSSLVQERVDFYENLGRKSPKPSPKPKTPSPLPVANNNNQLEAKAIELGKRLTAKTGINHSYVSLKELNNGAYGAYYNNGKANVSVLSKVLQLKNLRVLLDKVEVINKFPLKQQQEHLPDTIKIDLINLVIKDVLVLWLEICVMLKHLVKLQVALSIDVHQESLTIQV